jgi:HEAT repeat protein
MEALLAELTGGDDMRAELAALALARHGEAALQALRPLLESAQPDARWWAVRTLAEIPHGEAAPLLIQALQDEENEVRVCAAMALGRQRDERGVSPLIEAMFSKDALLARQAANALVATGAAAVPALLELMGNSTQPVRLEAARALALIGDPRAIPALYQALEEDSSLLYYWANEGLERMGVGMVFFKP